MQKTRSTTAAAAPVADDTSMHPNLAAAIDQLAHATAVHTPSSAAASAASASPSVLPHQYQAQGWIHAEDAATGGAGSAETDEEAAAAAADSAVLSLARSLSAEEAASAGGVLAQLATAHEQCFAAVTAPMGLPRPTASSPHLLSFTDPDTLMSATRWSSRVIGVVSDWVRLDGLSETEQAQASHPDATLPVYAARLSSEAAFKREVSWAVHLSLPALIVPNLRPGACANASRCINQALLQTQFLNLWIHVPLIAAAPAFDPCAPDADAAEAESQFSDATDPWRTWDAVRTACESHKRLGVCLELTADLPSLACLDAARASAGASSSSVSSSPEDYIVARWHGEPVRAVLLDSELFTTNRKGYPVLSKSHQKLIRALWKTFPHAQWILRDSAASPAATAADAADAAAIPPSSPPSLSLVPHNYYLRHLFRQHSLACYDPSAVFSRPYLDYLQAPLQPLADNLESGVYEVFERDPVKYRKYQEAIREALEDLAKAGRVGGPRGRPAEVMVVGAGRGPLLRCVLRASAESGVEVNLLAVEKNPNAVETLLSLQKHDAEFKDITIFSGDMREWNGPAVGSPAGSAAAAGAAGGWKADLIVSELLGSFGDNELSPECLESVLARFLCPVHGISIPENSVSFLVPLCSSKLWSDVNSFDALKSFETSYVVQLHNHYRASPQIQPCFKFEHYRPGFKGEEAEQAAAAAAEQGQAAVETEGGWTAEENPMAFGAERMRMEAVAAAAAVAASPDSAGSASASAASTAPSSHNRHTSLRWSIPLSCTVHGFGGYFCSRLYKSTEISITPDARFSKGMFSWFPLYFPIRTPLTLPSGSTLTADFWRCTSPRKVWYEWAITGPQASPIHNPNGRSAFIGL